MTAVNSAPAKIPITGLEKVVIRLTNPGISRSGAMEALIISIPMNNTPRPPMMLPKWVALRLFQKHHHRHADKGEERRQHSHIQGDQLSGDGGADIGPHNDPYRLPQGHHARVDKAHHHHGRGRGGLDDCSDDRAHQYAQQSVGRELFQYPLHSIARRSLQAGAHHLHPVEEQGKPPQQTQNIRNIHALYSFSVHRWKKT